VRQKGLRNIALLSIAPTGTISNIVLSYQLGSKNFIGVSGGIEPIFALYYMRRSESFNNQMFKMFHSTVDAYIQQHGLQERVAQVKDFEELKEILPAYFFRTAHFIAPDKRVEIQGVCQQYIDHSISSTVNLAEDIEPEIISNIYLDAWHKGLKGITIYREGSRFAILSVEGKETEFQRFAQKTFHFDGREIKGDEVIVLPSGRLTTAYHALRQGVMTQEGDTLHVVELATKQPERSKTWAREEEFPRRTEASHHIIENSLQRDDEEAESYEHIVSDQRVPVSPHISTAFAQEQQHHIGQMVTAPGARLMECPACNQQTLKMEVGCNTCLNEECGYGQCEA
jgi:ribonucleotide reductase alpha subunit